MNQLIFIFSSASYYSHFSGNSSFDPTILSITASLRHQVLQSYLRQLSTLLEETKYHPKLLLFLDLIPIPIVVEVAPDLADKETKL